MGKRLRSNIPDTEFPDLVEYGLIEETEEERFKSMADYIKWRISITADARIKRINCGKKRGNRDERDCTRGDDWGMPGLFWGTAARYCRCWKGTTCC